MDTDRRSAVLDHGPQAPTDPDDPIIRAIDKHLARTPPGSEEERRWQHWRPVRLESLAEDRYWFQKAQPRCRRDGNGRPNGIVIFDMINQCESCA
jgi:hypothetical protein